MLGNPAFFAESFTMCQTAFTESPSPQIRPTLSTFLKIFPSLMPAAIIQSFELLSNPIRNRNRPYVPALADEIDNRPAAFPLFEIAQSQSRRLAPPQPAGQQQRQQRPVPLAFHAPGIRDLPERLGLISR